MRSFAIACLFLMPLLASAQEPSLADLIKAVQVNNAATVEQMKTMQANNAAVMATQTAMKGQLENVQQVQVDQGQKIDAILAILAKTQNVSFVRSAPTWDGSTTLQTVTQQQPGNIVQAMSGPGMMGYSAMMMSGYGNGRRGLFRRGGMSASSCANGSCK